MNNEEKRPYWLQALEIFAEAEIIAAVAISFFGGVLVLSIAWVLFRWGLTLACQV